MARVGVFICYCGANIGGTINIDKVLEADDENGNGGDASHGAGPGATEQGGGATA